MQLYGFQQQLSTIQSWLASSKEQVCASHPDGRVTKRMRNAAAGRPFATALVIGGNGTLSR